MLRQASMNWFNSPVRCIENQDPGSPWGFYKLLLMKYLIGLMAAIKIPVNHFTDGWGNSHHF